jgi:hypothetical protein
VSPSHVKERDSSVIWPVYHYYHYVACVFCTSRGWR